MGFAQTAAAHAKLGSSIVQAFGSSLVQCNMPTRRTISDETWLAEVKEATKPEANHFYIATFWIRGVAHVSVGVKAADVVRENTRFWFPRGTQRQQNT